MSLYLDDGDVRLYHGDVLDELAAMEPGSVDCIVTSPPYNTLGSRIPDASKPNGLHTNNAWVKRVNRVGYADDMDEDEYAAWLVAVARGIARVARPGASFFFNHKVRYRKGVGIHPIDLVRQFDGWTLRQEIIWDRRRAMALNARMFAPSDERIYWLVKPGADYTWNQSALAMSVWTVIPGSDYVTGHPCPFPTGIPARCVSATTNPGDVVLDPFVGSGSTLVAALADGRRSIGIDIDEAYLRIASERIQQLSLLSSPGASALSPQTTKEPSS